MSDREQKLTILVTKRFSRSFIRAREFWVDTRINARESEPSRAEGKVMVNAAGWRLWQGSGRIPDAAEPRAV